MCVCVGMIINVDLGYFVLAGFGLVDFALLGVIPCLELMKSWVRQ